MKTVKLEMPESHWNVLQQLAASYYGNFEEIRGEFYSTDSVLTKLTREEHEALNRMFE